MVFDYHTHTTYSHGFIRPHGKGTVEENVQAAIERGLEELAISDHGPGHLFYGIKRNKFNDLRHDIEESQKRHPEIKLYMSCETNLTDKGNHLDVSTEEAKKFDFLIGGYHYGVAGCHAGPNWILAKKHYQEGGNNGIDMETSRKYERMREINTEMYIKALHENDLKILTHPGDKGPFDIDNIARACEDTGTLMEINGKHPHLDIEGIKTAAKYDVKFVISSDAHVPENVGVFEPQLMRALEAGLDPERIVNIAKR